jgi:hypothetical protein
LLDAEARVIPLPSDRTSDVMILALINRERIRCCLLGLGLDNLSLVTLAVYHTSPVLWLIQA